MSSRLAVLITCIPLALALGCDRVAGPDAGTGGPDLDDRTFLSQSVTEDDAERALVGGGPLRLSFSDDSWLSASAGCNSMGAEYQIEEGVLVVEEAGVTEIGCDTDLHEQDDWYFGFLSSSPTLELDGNSLVLERDNIRIEYLDEEVATPDLELVGPTWTVHTLIEGETASSASWDTPATLVFGQDTVEVTTGCNTGSGSYEVVGGTIEFDGVSVTEAACPDELAMELEAAVLGIVTAATPLTWEIDVANLSLLSAEDGSGLVLGGE